MKSMHFCTPKKLEEIKSSLFFSSIRTGWIPQLFAGETIKVKAREYQIPFDYSTPYKDRYLFDVEVLSNTPVKFKDVGDEHQEEIQRYNKKFHPEQYFFEIKFMKKQGQKTLF